MFEAGKELIGVASGGLRSVAEGVDSRAASGCSGDGCRGGNGEGSQSAQATQGVAEFEVSAWSKGLPRESAVEYLSNPPALAVFVALGARYCPLV